MGHGQAGKPRGLAVVSLVVLVFALLIPPMRATAATSYAAVLLDTGGYPDAAAATISGDGTIVGRVGDFSTYFGTQFAAVWRPLAAGGYGAPILLAPPAGYRSTSVWAQNDSGILVGSAIPTDHIYGYGHAAVWRPNGTGGYTFTDLTPTLGNGTFGQATAVSKGGVLVGMSDLGMTAWLPDGTGGYRAVGLTGGGSCGSQVVMINAKGVIAGPGDAGNGTCSGAVWRPSATGYGAAELLPLPSGVSTMYAGSINESGIMLGNALANGRFQGYVWTPDKTGAYSSPPAALAPPAGETDAWPQPYGIERNGTIRGEGQVNHFTGDPSTWYQEFRAYVWLTQPGGGYGAAIRLPGLGGNNTFTNAMNDTGTVVGVSQPATPIVTGMTPEYLPVVWRAKGRAYELTQLPTAGKHYGGAASINTNGVIVGWAGDTTYGSSIALAWTVG